MDLYSMRLINVRVLLEMEELMKRGERVDYQAKVLEFCDDEPTNYAILSHRWIGQEVEYDEIVELAKMDEEKRNEIRQRDGYRKILDSCKQAKKDGYEWLWADTCCIDRRSSAELSEAINSMYRWYENAQVCYAYLHDVHDSSFPVRPEWRRGEGGLYHGWPEWFSRGWTLQEMIAPSNVQFFNAKWQAIGDKRTLARKLEEITGVPKHILRNGLSGNRPCVAQIMSWAANRVTTRDEDRAYSLMGLLDVNMPTLYGEGKKAFHRLQLEIIHKSNDQSIFAWSDNGRMPYERRGQIPGNILANDPYYFRGCRGMELMKQDEFIKSLRKMQKAELPSTENGQLGTSSITSHGIQIWLFLSPIRGSVSVVLACLPCRSQPWGPPVAISLRSWESNYYRCSDYDIVREFHPEGTLRFCQVSIVGDPEKPVDPQDIIMRLLAEAKRQQDLLLVKELEAEYLKEVEAEPQERFRKIPGSALSKKETDFVFMSAEGVIDRLRTRVGLDMAIRLGRLVVAVHIPGHGHVESLRKLINLLTERFQEQDAISDLDELIMLHHAILALLSRDDKAPPSLLHGAAHCFWSRFRRQGRTCDLEEAIAFEWAALRLYQHGHADHVKSFHNVVHCHGELRKAGKVTDVEELIALWRTVLELDLSDRADYTLSLQKLALWVSEGFNPQAVTVDSIQGAITLTDSVLTFCPTDDPKRPVLLKAIATYRRKKFESHVKGDIDGVTKLIGVAVYDTLKTLPTRLLNTLTGHLRGRDELMSDFNSSAQYKELVAPATNSHPPSHEYIQEAVSSYFQYATLSHRWGSDEPVLRDVQGQVIYKMESPHGIIKLQSFCAEASERGYRWAWSDTCCIDKESSAELQEAIGSMFVWYRRSALTIVHLADVSDGGALSNSVWFKRGWTLQELLAPRAMLFFTQDWSPYGECSSSNHKEDTSIVLAELEKVTNIPRSYLTNFRPGMDHDDARSRLQWASTRYTTRPEDMAYSLFGVFDVHLPVLYGESAERALGRLLTEIISRSGDISVLEWVGEASSFHSCFPTHIDVYRTLPSPSSHADQIQSSISNVHELVPPSQSLDKLFTSLSKLGRPHFIGRTLQLPCIVHRVTAIRPKPSTHSDVYVIQAEGLTQIELKDKFKNDPLSTFTYVLIRPWYSKLLPSSTVADTTASEQSAVTLDQSFHVLLLEELSQNEYRRIASSSAIIARAAGAAGIFGSSVQTLNIL